MFTSRFEAVRSVRLEMLVRDTRLTIIDKICAFITCHADNHAYIVEFTGSSQDFRTALQESHVCVPFGDIDNWTPWTATEFGWHPYVCHHQFLRIALSQALYHFECVIIIAAEAT